MFASDYKIRVIGSCCLRTEGIGKAAFDYVSSTTPGVLCEEIKPEDCSFDLVVTVRLKRSPPEF